VSRTPPAHPSNAGDGARFASSLADRRAHTRPNHNPADVEDAVVRLRRDLVDAGLEAGARTIHWHLTNRGDDCPSVSTIWRILAGRGLSKPQPKKRPA
jgi:hypothetical protein